MKKNFDFFIAIVILLTINSSGMANVESPKMLISASGFRYITGGIGEDETLDMLPYAKRFTLNLQFSEGKVGRSATNIHVNIYDEKGSMVFRLRHAKPILYVNLPTGTYTIVANNNGTLLRHKLNIQEKKHNKVILNWKDEVEEDKLIEKHPLAENTSENKQ